MQTFKRILFITAWTAAAFWGWVLAWGLAFRFLTGSSRQALVALLRGLPEWLGFWLLPGLLVGGTFLVTIGALLLGMRGKLPGTRKSHSPRRGFEVETMP